ncbi:MAG: hypothetical protein JSR66_05720 [Proteobacteria bacterium]|nr:hypothetical protein [Pseudomonadota bacterium]
MIMKRVWIAQHERALVWKNKAFAGVLTPGRHGLFAPFSQVELQVCDLTVPEFEHPRVDFLVKEARKTLEPHFDIVELTESEVGLVYKNGKLAGVLAPGKRQLYWKGPIEVKVERIDISVDLEVPARVAQLLARAKPPLAVQSAEAVALIEVPDTSGALLIVDGQLRKVLESGLHVFWKFQRSVKFETVDRRAASGAPRLNLIPILRREPGSGPAPACTL